MPEDTLVKSKEDDIQLMNVLEEIVKLKVDETIKSIDMCQCEHCRLDACAIALNVLPQKYVTTFKGSLFSKIDYLNADFQMEIQIEVFKALKAVKEHPRHN
jgi:competence protein ComFB